MGHVSIASTVRVMLRSLACLLFLGVLAACTTGQVVGTTQVQPLSLTRGRLAGERIALLTPSSVTGQEEDKQGLAIAVFDVLNEMRPEQRAIALPSALTAINQANLSQDYRRMLDDYRATGLFERAALSRIGAAVGARFLVQLKLSSFRQESKSRWGTLGLRILETKSTTVRLFMQIWDSAEGAIVWEGMTEITSAYDSVSEETVAFSSVIKEAARRLVAKMP